MLNSEACTSISLDKSRYQAAASRMFVREKRINGYTYLDLVETVRENGRAKQRIIKNLGRKEAVTASGALERLASSVARYAERALVWSQIEAGNPERLACTRIGAPLLLRAAVGGDRLPRGGGGPSRRAGLRVPGRARRLRHRAAPDHGLRLGPGLREVAGRL